MQAQFITEKILKFRKTSTSKKKIVSIVSIVFKITLTDCLEKKTQTRREKDCLEKQTQTRRERDCLEKHKATATMVIVHRLLWLLI